MRGNEAILYKFVRSCLNRAYVRLNDKQLSADEKYFLDVLLTKIRDSESSWKTLDDLLKFLDQEFFDIVKEAFKRLPKEIVISLFKNTIELCLELEEVKSNQSLVEFFKNLIPRIEQIANEVAKK